VQDVDASVPGGVQSDRKSASVGGLETDGKMDVPAAPAQARSPGVQPPPRAQLQMATASPGVQESALKFLLMCSLLGGLDACEYQVPFLFTAKVDYFGMHLFVTWYTVVGYLMTLPALTVAACACARLWFQASRKPEHPPIRLRPTGRPFCRICGAGDHTPRRCDARFNVDDDPPAPHTSPSSSGASEADEPEPQLRRRAQPARPEPVPAPARPEPVPAAPPPQAAPPAPQQPAFWADRHPIAFGRHRGRTYGEAARDHGYVKWVGLLPLEGNMSDGLRHFREYLWNSGQLQDPRRTPAEDVD